MTRQVFILNSLPTFAYPFYVYYLRTDGKYYGWDAVNNRFYNFSTPNIDDLVGINFEDLQDGDVLSYDSATQKWINKAFTVTKSYGSWKNDESQFAATNTEGYGIKFNTPDISEQGINIEADLLGNKTLIKFLNPGTYNIQFSCQFENLSTQFNDVSIWLRKNGQDASADVIGTARYITIPAKYDEINGRITVSFNYFVEAIVDDYFQLVWATTNSEVISMKSYEAVSPTPSSYSSILTVSQIN